MFFLGEEHAKLQKIIQVDLKSEISKQQSLNEKLVDRTRHLTEDLKRSEYQLQRVIGKPLDHIEQREEAELWREKKLIEQEKELEERDRREQELNE